MCVERRWDPLWVYFEYTPFLEEVTRSKDHIRCRRRGYNQLHTKQRGKNCVRKKASIGSRHRCHRCWVGGHTLKFDSFFVLSLTLRVSPCREFDSLFWITVLCVYPTKPFFSYDIPAIWISNQKIFESDDDLFVFSLSYYGIHYRFIWYFFLRFFLLYQKKRDKGSKLLCAYICARKLNEMYSTVKSVSLAVKLTF